MLQLLDNKYFIDDVLESIDVEGASCCGCRRVNIFLDDILEFIDVEGASCCNYGRINIL